MSINTNHWANAPILIAEGSDWMNAIRIAAQQFRERALCALHRLTVFQTKHRESSSCIIPDKVSLRNRSLAASGPCPTFWTKIHLCNWQNIILFWLGHYNCSESVMVNAPVRSDLVWLTWTLTMQCTVGGRCCHSTLLKGELKDGERSSQH